MKLPKLPKLPVYVSIPDWPPSCEICGHRGEKIGDFLHTNFKGAFYKCNSGNADHLFTDQEDDFFSVEYWNMAEKQRRIYEQLTEGQRRVFLEIDQKEQTSFLRLSRHKRQTYMAERYKAAIDEFDEFVNAEFYKYEIYS